MQERQRRSSWMIAAWVVVALWHLLLLLTLTHNGPFFDEGIYVTAGLRTLEGYGSSDGYLGWFAGSLLWPVLAAVGYTIAGLAGTRMVALILATIALAAVVQASRNLFGEKAAFWTAVAFSLSGPLLALARLGVYDLPALAGIAVSFWAITELHRRDHRFWLGLAALAYAVAAAAKYPAALMLLPLVGTLVVLRRQKAALDLGIMAFLTAGLLLVLFLPVRMQIADLVAWQVANKPTFGVTVSMIAFAAGFASVGVPAPALGGWVVTRERRLLATVLLLSLVIWPVYHILSGNPVGVEKHLVLGFLFAYPLAGRFFSALWEAPRSRGLTRSAVLLAVAVLGLLGFLQAYQYDQGWPDARPAARYLVEHVRPGDQLLINESWPYTMYLYAEGRIRSPWDVYDAYRVIHGESEIELCEYEWYVDSRGSYEWPDSVRATIEACGTFEEAHSSSSTVVQLGEDLRFVSFSVPITVWHNHAQETAGE